MAADGICETIHHSAQKRSEAAITESPIVPFRTHECRAKYEHEPTPAGYGETRAE